MPKKPTKINDINAERDVVMGDQYTQFVTQIGAFTPPPDLIQLRKDYLAHIERSYHALDFKGIPQVKHIAKELPLEEVYVPLMARPELPEGETWDRRVAGRGFDKTTLPEEALHGMERGMASSAPVQIEEALREKQRVVVLGDPGSGKSTMLKYLALRLAKDPNAPLPIPLPLNAYARALTQKEINLQAYLAEYYAARAESVASLAPLFKEAIDHGKAVILLDGLDEVQNSRAALVQKVEAFAYDAITRGNRVLVTSRIVGYRDTSLSAKDWSLHTLLDFTPEAIQSFAGKWCLAVEKSVLGDTPEAVRAANTEKESLLEALQNNPGVERLASNPLLLTILALIKRQGVILPKNRIKLYDLYLETLIQAWNSASTLDKSAGRESMNYADTLAILGPLALRVREENPTAGLVSEYQLQEWLAEYYVSEWDMKAAPAREKAREFIKSVHDHSNLLVERGDRQYGFIHLTFEEALAAYGLVDAGQMELQKSLNTIQSHLVDPAWHETILLSVGVLGLVKGLPKRAGAMVQAILNMKCDDEHAGHNILLAGACLEDVGESGLGRAATVEIQSALMDAMYNRALPPAVQRDAGFSLARTDWTPKDLDAWVHIPAGEFLYGDDKQRMVIEKPFAMQKYPVTNLQFKRFMLDRGYDNKELWSVDGWSWRTGTYDSKADESNKKWLSNRPVEKRHEPYYWHDEKWNNPLAPVVGVTWFESEAYANWLAKQTGREVRLPTEQEWERAARGTKGREYTWGDTFDKNKANCAEFWGNDNELDWDKWVDQKGYEIASTSIIGQFKNGNTPEGIYDLSGNVWEWTASWYEKEQVNRTLRGGSWIYNRRNVRCASRYWIVPDNFNLDIGFRVLSPGSDI